MNTTRFRKGRFIGICAACVMATLAAVMMAGLQNDRIAWAENREPLPEATSSAQALSSAFRHASNAVLPAVVTIRNTPDDHADVSSQRSTELPEEFGQLPDEFRPFLKRFFGDDPSFTPRPRLHAPPGERMGSGVIIDSAGVILTNNHVVHDAGRIVVTLQDGREFEAADVHTDPDTDIAVLRIETTDTLPYANVGDSDDLEIGDWVLAVGSPFGLSETVTAGIISAKARGLGITDREEFLQTDAAINPGNSGGPLVNLLGEVVGINTAISTRGGGNDGVGFAVPINMARWVADQLVANGTVRRAFLGVGIQPVTSDLAHQFGLADISGALVTEVRTGSAAAEAGLQIGDVITRFDEVPINNLRTLQRAVEQADLATPHELQVIRDGQSRQFEIDLQPMPELASSTESQRDDVEEDQFESLGLELSDLTKQSAESLSIEFESGGVLIAGVLSGSPADRAGLQPGMVIRRVGQADVSDVNAFGSAISDAGDQVLLLVSTASGSRFVVLNLG